MWGKCPGRFNLYYCQNTASKNKATCCGSGWYTALSWVIINIITQVDQISEAFCILESWFKKYRDKDECCQIKKGFKEMPKVWGMCVGWFPLQSSNISWLKIAYVLSTFLVVLNNKILFVIVVLFCFQWKV